MKGAQGRAGQGRAGQGRAGQGRARQGRAGQGRAGQGRAGQGRAPVELVEELSIRGHLALRHGCKSITANLCSGERLGLGVGHQGLHQGTALCVCLHQNNDISNKTHHSINEMHIKKSSWMLLMLSFWHSRVF